MARLFKGGYVKGGYVKKSNHLSESALKRDTGKHGKEEHHLNTTFIKTKFGGGESE